VKSDPKPHNNNISNSDQAKVAMKLYRYSLNAAASLAGFAAISGVAYADNVDYGALEELFNEPVTTSATGAPQRATEAPVNMTIITQDEIRRSGAIDIPGVLERYAQVDVERNARGDANVSIRGYDQGYSPRLLVILTITAIRTGT
jgi:iron complex outermembrane receptor protein